MLQHLYQAGELPVAKGQDLDSVGTEGWIQAAVTTINHLYQCPQSESGRDSTALKMPEPNGKLKANQLECMRQLEAEVEDYLQTVTGEELQVECKEWQKYLGKRKLDYSGRMVAKAEELTWKQVEPALPKVGQAAQVSAIDLAEGIMKEFIRDPWKSMKHKNDWPKNFKKARSLVATQEDLHNIAHGLYQRNMSRIVEGHEILYDSQGVALSGALFGVAKDKMLEEDPCLALLRLILNLVPPDEVQNKIHGDNASLPYFGQWRSILVRKGGAIYLSSKDMKACFFLFQLPKEWSPFFMISEMVPGWTHGRPELEWVHFGLTTIPIGWINAAGNRQYLHERLVAKSSMLPKHLELQSNAPFPVNQDFVTSSFLELIVDSLESFASGSYGQSDAGQARTSHWINSEGSNAWPEWFKILQLVNSTADWAKQEQTNTGSSIHRRPGRIQRPRCSHCNREISPKEATTTLCGRAVHIGDCEDLHFSSCSESQLWEPNPEGAKQMQIKTTPTRTPSTTCAWCKGKLTKTKLHATLCGKVMHFKFMVQHPQVRQGGILASTLAHKWKPMPDLDQVEAKSRWSVLGRQPGSLGHRVSAKSDTENCLLHLAREK